MTPFETSIWVAWELMTQIVLHGLMNSNEIKS